MSGDYLLTDAFISSETKEEALQNIKYFVEKKYDIFPILKEVEKQNSLEDLIKCQFPPEYLGCLLMELLEDGIVDSNEKEVLRYLTKWDKQFNTGILQFKPFINYRHLYDIDRDGIKNEDDEYPFSYYNTEPIFVQVMGAYSKVAYLNRSLVAPGYFFRELFEKQLFYDTKENYFILPIGLNSDEIKNDLSDILSNSKGKKVNLLLSMHGGADASIASFVSSEDGSIYKDFAKIYVEELNEVFKDKKYAELNIFAELCHNTVLANTIRAEKSRFFYSDTELNYSGFFQYKLLKQIELRISTPEGMLSENKYSETEEYRPNFLMEPTLEEDMLPTKDLPIFEPYYKNKKFK